MWYPIITIATPSIYLTLSFGGGQRSSPLLLQFFLLQAWALSVYAGEKEALRGVNAETTEQQSSH